MIRLIISILISFSTTTLSAVTRVQGDSSQGMVDIPKDITVTVVDARGERMTIQFSETAAPLPVGKYRIESWMVERKDEEGNLWKLTGTNLGKKGSFRIIASREVKLSTGEPVVSSLTAEKSDSSYRVEQHLRGRLSETIEITKNGSHPDAPELHITNADGSQP